METTGAAQRRARSDALDGGDRALPGAAEGLLSD